MKLYWLPAMQVMYKVVLVQVVERTRVLYPVHLHLIPMSICTSQSLFSHSYVVNECLNRHCDVRIDIGIRADELGTGVERIVIKRTKKLI
jgi:hypothetical protein